MNSPVVSIARLCALLAAALALIPGISAAAPVVYLAGDSTVMSYGSGNYPQQGWGGRLHDYFTSGVSFSNRAIGGRSSKSFVDEGRLASILGVIKPGDYLFVQFGHNDGYSDPRLHTDPYTSFKTYLSMYIDQARQYGATPVLVTPMGRRYYDSSGRFINDFVDRTAAMKQLATAKGVALIDLNSKSIGFYNGIGVAATTDVFLYAAAGQYPRFPNGVADTTHFQDYGAGQLARLVVQGIEENRLALRTFIGAVAYPAEAGVLSGVGMLRTKSYAGWQGKGYVDFPASGGALMLGNLIGKTGGLRTLRIRYANGAAGVRTGQLVVNGAATSISFNPTGAWTTWSTKDVPVWLAAGSANAVSLRSTGADLANVDTITVY
jgi:lysophospholipase L1-like esterase